MTRVFLGIGSNQGNRIGNISKALAILNEKGIEVKKISSFYETSPVGYLKQRWFINAVCEIYTKLMPMQLLHMLKSIEKLFGRKKTGMYMPRKMDLDILLYGKNVIKTKQLSIPHPQMENRAFVLVPLAELNPRLKFPRTNKTIAQMLGKVLQGNGQTIKLYRSHG